MARAQQRRVRNARILTRNRPWTPQLMDWLPDPNGDTTMTMEILNFGGALVLAGVPEVFMFPSGELPVSAELVGNTVILDYGLPQLPGQSYQVRTWNTNLRDSFGAYLTQKYWLTSAPAVPPVPVWLDWVPNHGPNNDEITLVPTGLNVPWVIDSIAGVRTLPTLHVATGVSQSGNDLIFDFGVVVALEVALEITTAGIGIWSGNVQVPRPQSVVM